MIWIPPRSARVWFLFSLEVLLTRGGPLLASGDHPSLEASGLECEKNIRHRCKTLDCEIKLRYEEKKLRHSFFSCLSFFFLHVSAFFRVLAFLSVFAFFRRFVSWYFAIQFLKSEPVAITFCAVDWVSTGLSGFFSKKGKNRHTYLPIEPYWWV